MPSTGRWSLAVAGVAVALFVAQLWTTFAIIRQDRTESLEQFTGERQSQLRTALMKVDEELDDYLGTLELLVHLVDGDDIHRHRPEIEAVLRHRPGLHAVAVGTPGEPDRFLTRSDEVRELGIVEGNEALHDHLFEQALSDAEETGGELGTSDSHLDSQGRLLRAFVRMSERQPERSVGILVDMRVAFATLETLATDAESELLVLGPNRQFEAFSTVETLTGTSIDSEDDPWPLADQMRTEKSGVERIDESTARELELEGEEQILTYDSLEVTPEVTWAVGTLTSLEPVRASERAMMWRVGGVSAAFGLLLFGFGGFGVYSWRRQRRLHERLEHTREVARLHAKSDAILNAIPTGVVVVDEQLHIEEVNPQMAEWLGAGRAGQPLEQVWEEVTEAEREETREKFVDQLFGDGTGGAYGEPILLEPVDFGDGPVHMQVRIVALRESHGGSTVVAFQDVSEVKHLESQLLRAEKLATVGVLAAGVAHEIGTPLGVVRGRAEYAMSMLDEQAPVAEHLEIVVDQVDYVSGIVEELLDFSRREAPDIQPADLEKIVDKSLQLVEFQRDGGTVEVAVDIAEDVPKLAASPDELQQVLVNLLINACQACREEGRVEIEARPSDGRGGESEAVTLEVRDNGEGIAPEDQHRIFDPFFTTKKRGKGTGLGLPIVQKIVRNHGGEIQLESTKGVGTTFTVRWPTYRSTAEDASPAGERDVAELRSEGSHERIR